jgi:hypothetical protein
LIPISNSDGGVVTTDVEDIVVDTAITRPLEVTNKTKLSNELKKYIISEVIITSIERL